MDLKLLKEIAHLTEGVIVSKEEPTNPDVLVKGVGRYKLVNLEKNVRSKLNDLAESASKAKDAHAWGQVEWKVNHAAMHEMIKTIKAAYKELDGDKEEPKNESLKEGLGSKINWDNFNLVNNHTKHGLSLGEEKTLSDDEVKSVNVLLSEMASNAKKLDTIFYNAAERFKTKKK